MPEMTEWSFAADAAKWITFHAQRMKGSPFSEAKVEIKGTGSRKRSDVILYDRDGRKALTGEIKLPDTKEGQTPFNSSLVADARRKARRLGAPYFFTWNVNRLVLWQTDLDAEIRPPFDVVLIRRSAEIELAVIQRKIRDEFIPRFIDVFARIYRGDEPLGTLPLDQRFIGRLESVLLNVSNAVFEEAIHRYAANRPFKKALDNWMREQEWLLSEDQQQILDNLDRATRLACYITANKLVFYQALRRTRRFKLTNLSVPAHIDSADRLRDHFNELFHKARLVTHDYETILEGSFIDRVPFITDIVVDRWRLLVDLLNEFDFRKFGEDVIGHIFEDLLSPEERHRWGQHYTQPDVVDVITSFCIRERNAIVLDPGSGSGTFPVRAYVRKKFLAKGGLSHADLLAQIYACEISEYAAHLTALNLATRDLIDGENFPRVARADFFDTEPTKPFTSIPDTTSSRIKHGDIADRDIYLKHVDAVVGNPPYLRQEEIGQKNKARYYAIVREEWSGLKLSGRSDLHLYFWPHAASLLSEGGYFGFLTSASWLDVEYGFHLQRWILTNFEIIGVLESICEPWFTGARVATAVTVLRRCNDSQRRMQNVVKFVQLRKPLKELLEHDGTEVGRQEAVERLRELIEKTTEHRRTNAYRILAIPQEKLWQDGCYLKRICRDRNVDEPSETETTSSRSPSILREEPNSYGDLSDYLGSKWGVYLRAPDLYFELMERFGGAFVPLGEIADIRYGFKSGCDAFFTPTDISAEALEVEDAAEFRHRYHCSQQEVRTGKLRIIRAGDGSEHPVERKYLSREVHSLMSIEGVRLNDDIERVILLVNEPVQALKGTYVLDYLKYGERENFGADTTVPNRDTCAARPLWYDLTNYPTGRIILPIIVQYRHIVSWNPDSLPVNHALMAVDCKDMERNKALAAVLNSTLIAFIKPYFSRKLGNEANTQLDVYAANILPMPNVMKMPDMMIERLAGAFDGLGSRAILQLVEQRFLDIKHPKDLRAQETEPRELPIELQQPDRQRLDRAVLSAIGVSSAEQEALLDKLYREVTRFWNEARVVEIQAIENRKRSRRGRSTNAREVAAEIFSQLEPSIIRSFPDGFLPTDEVLETVELPEGRAKLFDAHDLYDANVLAVGNTRITLRHRPQAELAKFYCDLGRTGFVKLPISEASCISVKNGWIQYVTEMQDIFRPLATERTADEDQIEAIAAELERMLYRPDRETS